MRICTPLAALICALALAGCSTHYSIIKRRYQPGFYISRATETGAPKQRPSESVITQAEKSPVATMTVFAVQAKADVPEQQVTASVQRIEKVKTFRHAKRGLPEATGHTRTPVLAPSNPPQTGDPFLFGLCSNNVFFGGLALLSALIAVFYLVFFISIFSFLVGPEFLLPAIVVILIIAAIGIFIALNSD